MRDGVTVIAMLRNRALNDSTLTEFDALVGGMADELEVLLAARGETALCSA